MFSISRFMKVNSALLLATFILLFLMPGSSSGAGPPTVPDIGPLELITSFEKFVASDAMSGDQFGASIAISEQEGGADPSVIKMVIGAPGHDGGKGAAYIFEKPTTGSWSQVKQLTLDDVPGTQYKEGAQFGRSVAIYGDTVVIGAPNKREGIVLLDAAGAVYIFKRGAGGGWTFSQKLTHNPAGSIPRYEGDQFGSSVAISPYRIVAGAPGRDIIPGTPLFLDAGTVYIFEQVDQNCQPQSEWRQIQELTHSIRLPGDRFGSSVATDKSKIIAGAPGVDIVPGIPELADTGGAYLYEMVGPCHWQEKEKFTHSFQLGGDLFGTSVAIDEDRIVVGAPKVDAVPNIFPGIPDILADTGAAFIYEPDETDNWHEVKKLFIPLTDQFGPGDIFGHSVALRGDLIAVSAPGRDLDPVYERNAGYAYFFQWNDFGERWERTDTLFGAHVTGDDLFGSSVSIGAAVAVGAPFEESGVDDSGAAYMFSLPLDVGEAVPWLANFGYNQAWRAANHLRMMADVNGDGMADVVGFGDAGVGVALSTGSSFDNTSTPQPWVTQFGFDQEWDVNKHPRMMADVDGDGNDDVVGFGHSLGGSDDYGVYVSLSDPDHSKFEPPVLWIDNFSYEKHWWREQTLRMMADVNGDGMADVVGFGHYGVGVALSTGSSFDNTSTSQPWVTQFGYNQGWDVNKHPRMMADVDGDGKDDVVGFYDDGLYVSLSQGTSFASPVRWIDNFGYNSSAGSWRVENHPRMMADVNGDGMADVVGFGDYGVGVALSTGYSFDNSSTPQPWNDQFGYSLEAGWWRVEKHPRMMADIDGNGKADVIGFGDEGVGVALSTGSEFYNQLWRASFGFNDNWTVGEHPRMMADVNGDGKDDAVGFGLGGVYVILSDFTAPLEMNAANSSVTVNETETASNSGTLVSDVDIASVILSASVGTAVNHNDGTWSWSFTTSDGPAESQTVTVLANDGTSTSTTAFDLVVNNLPPSTPIITGPATGLQGFLVSLEGSATDPAGDNDPISLDWSVTKDGTLLFTGSGPTFDFTPAETGTYQVTLTASDGDGGSASTLHTVAIDPYYPPILTVDNQDVTVDEGEIAGNSGTVGAAYGDSLTMSATGPEGSVVGTVVKNDGTWSWDFTTNDGPPDSQTVTISADDGISTGSVTFELTVNNVPPTPNIPEPTTELLEGSPVALTGLADDPAEANDPISFDWSVTTADGVVASGEGPNIAFIPADNGDYEVTLTATDDDGGTASTARTVTVNNVPPTPSISEPTAELLEGSPVSLVGSATDPAGANDTISLAWSVTKNGESFVDGTGANIDFTPDDNGTYEVTLTASDEDGGSAISIRTITVDNVAPAVGPIDAPTDPVQIGAEIIVSADFTDPGTADTHTAVWDWGDGSNLTVDIVGGSRSVVGNHTYIEPAVYTVRLTVTDDDGSSDESIYQFVVVYDPEGGFVTGGGWIDSPPGACNFGPCEDDTTGKATFGFVSKYKKGATEPTGQTEFQFKAGNLNFHSSNYEWLVVAHHKAQFKGTGTINGTGNYGFMVSAIDEELTPSTDADLFRIKIWDRDNDEAIVYDNQVECSDVSDDADPCTIISGGNIVIHEG